MTDHRDEFAELREPFKELSRGLVNSLKRDRESGIPSRSAKEYCRRYNERIEQKNRNAPRGKKCPKITDAIFRDMVNYQRAVFNAPIASSSKGKHRGYRWAIHPRELEETEEHLESRIRRMTKALMGVKKARQRLEKQMQSSLDLT